MRYWFLVSIFSLDVCAQTIQLDGIEVASLELAMKEAKNGSVITLSEGEFKQAGVLNANNVTITGQYNKTKIHSKAAWGKGALVIRGHNTLIENIECFNIQVPSQNGACIRLDGKDLSVNFVYFHDAEQGILTGDSPGRVSINNSRFERLGKGGQAHGIYVGGGTLQINNSFFLSSKDQGHEIKSRAKKTVITNSLIASLNGVDSRLVDTPIGGILEITDSILQQGNYSSNWNLIGYGLEGIKHKVNQVKIIGNLFILEGLSSNKILDLNSKEIQTKFTYNTLVGKFTDKAFEPSNIHYKTLQQAGINSEVLIDKKLAEFQSRAVLRAEAN